MGLAFSYGRGRPAADPVPVGRRCSRPGLSLSQQGRKPMRFLGLVAILAYLLQAATTVAAAATVYKLGPGDELRLKVYDWRRSVGDVHQWSPLNGDFTIAPDGRLSLPLIGSVPAAGSTIEQLAGAISLRLQRAIGLDAKPQTSVEVAKYRPFYILGSVSRPGGYQYRPGLTVLQAVSLAGGLLRVRDPGLLEKTAGDLDVLEAEYERLLARRARLRAERDDRPDISFPPELMRRQDDAAVKELLQQQRAIFAARRDALTSQTEALKRLKRLLNDEVVSLQAKMKNVDEQLLLLRRQLASTSSLVKHGLEIAPRAFSLRQNTLEIEGRRLDLDEAALRAREEIEKANQAVLALKNKTRTEIVTDLADVGNRISKTASHIATARALLNIEGGGAALGERNDGSIYMIFRRAGGSRQNIAATAASEVQPGDTIEVAQSEGGLPVRASATGAEAALRTSRGQ